MPKSSQLPVSENIATRIYNTLIENKLLVPTKRSKKFWVTQITTPFTELRLHPMSSLKLYYANRSFYLESEHLGEEDINVILANKALLSIYREHLAEHRT